MTGVSVVSYRNSTSNHNLHLDAGDDVVLYLIEILHQTTTPLALSCSLERLYLIEILHQTTTIMEDTIQGPELYLIEILHQTTTLFSTIAMTRALYLIEILHQTTTSFPVKLANFGCILSKFYIKPQLVRYQLLVQRVVSYRNSTSNHNYRGKKRIVVALYLIEILHQTTTQLAITQPLPRCILSKFYIKPQLIRYQLFVQRVVSYRNSTSNHNSRFAPGVDRPVVSYRNSTSNHNSVPSAISLPYVVSYRNSTSNHNRARSIYLQVKVVSYRNSTSNHNCRCLQPGNSPLYLIEILHQTTTPWRIELKTPGCILSKFYIKPQRRPRCRQTRSCCILSKFYIKPQQEPPKPYNAPGCILSKFYIKPQRRASY